MTQIKSLIKREFLEYKSSCFMTPLFVALVVALTHNLFIPNFRLQDIRFDGVDSFFEDKHLYYSYFLYVSIPFFFVLFFTQLNYFSQTLFYDRKDRSALFWASMPVSDAKTILSKIFFGTLVLPLCFSFVSLFTSLALFFLLAYRVIPGAFSMLGYLGFIQAGSSLFLSFLYISFWSFPVFSWALLCSAYVKRSPLLMTIVGPFLFIFFEVLLKRESSYVFNFLSTILKNVIRLDYSALASPDALVAVFVGLVLSFVAYSLRRRCFRFELS